MTYYQIQYQTSDRPVGPRHRTYEAAIRAADKARREARRNGDAQAIRVVRVTP